MRSLAAAHVTALTLALGACGVRDEVEFPPMEQRLPDQQLGAAIREHIAGAPDDVLEIVDPHEAVLDGTTILIADFGGHRILRVDTAFALLHAFGAEGAGPGELMRPTMAVPWNDELVVGEWSNGRFSIFDRDGNYRRTVRGAARPESHGVRRDGGIVMQSASREYYALVLSPDGSATPFARRPGSLRADSGTQTLGGEGTLLLVGADDTTHVFDNEWGVLLKYDGGGRLVLGRSVPDEVLAPVREYRKRFVEAFARQGRRVVGMPLTHTMSFADDGSILIHIGRGSTTAIRIDPADYSVRRITADMSDPVWALVSSAASALIRSDTYYTISDAGLAAYPLVEGKR